METKVQVFENLEELLVTINKTKEEIRASKELNVPFKMVSYECCKQIVEAFPDLKTLDINTGQMNDDYMKEISKLKDLRELDVSANRITNIGVKYLSELKHIRRLDLSLCDINDGCLDDIVKMKELETLHLSGTEISIFNLNKLEKLEKLKDGDFRRADCANSLPDELINQRNIRNILDFIKTKTNGMVPIGNHRIVLLGEPAVGKTALFNKLCGYEYYKTTSTFGVNIQSYNSNNLEGNNSEYNPIRGFNIWDFGGQITQGTIHNMFLSDNCLFVIVIEPRMNDCERDFMRWYRSVYQYLLNPDYNLPLLVVFSKCDNANGGVGSSLDLDSVINDIERRIRQEIQEEQRRNGTNIDFIDLKFIKSSSIAKNGLNQLLYEIDEALKRANTLDRLKVNEFQKKLLSALKAKEKENNTFFIDYNTIKKCAKDISGVEINDNDLVLNLNYLTKFGDIFYHSSLNRMGVFVNPSKISEIVYEILIGYNKMGKVTDVTFQNINQWFQLENETIARAILLLLKAKNFIFQKPFEIFCIPSRLEVMPFDLPKETFKNYLGVRHFIFQFKPNVVGMTWKIISQLYNRENVQQGEKYFFDDKKIFRDGFLVAMNSNYGEEKAVIKENVKENRIDVWITSTSKKNIGGLWGVLKQVIPDSLVGIVNGENSYTLFCVCPCKGRWENECEHIHLYKKIETNYEKNTYTICTESNLVIYPQNLLFDSQIEPTPISNIKKKIYVIMPFDVPENEKFYEEIEDCLMEIYEDFKEHIEKPFICKNPQHQNKTIIDVMRQEIYNSNIILTILDNRKLNVYYEFGLSMAYAHLHHITFINKNDFDDKPFNTKMYTQFPIDYNNIKKFKEELTKQLKNIL